MAINKNVRVGRHTNVTTIQFGTGDILISQGYEPDSKNKVLTFGQHVKKPQEYWHKDVPTGGDTDGLENPVIFYFDNVDSVDTVIRALEKIKISLQSDPEQIK
jgi:hypothetical protein